VFVDVTPEELERAEFDTADEGFDPEAVRELLRKAAARMRALEREGVKSVSESVSAVLDQAVKSGEELVASATKDADAVRAAAEADAERIAGDAAAVAAKSIADGEKTAAERIEEAEKHVEEILATAEKNARERSTQVINEAQQRLDRLLAAERDVHDRLQAAMTDIQASVSRVGVSQAAELALTVEDPNSDVAWADDAAEELAAARQSA
jgi:DivIVA domain-containing protein